MEMGNRPGLSGCLAAEEERKMKFSTPSPDCRFGPTAFLDMRFWIYADCILSTEYRALILERSVDESRFVLGSQTRA